MSKMDCFLSLSEEELSKVENCGRNMVPPSEIPYLIRVDEFAFESDFRTQGSDVRRAYMRGFTETSFKIHEVNREIAEAGSPMAIAEVMRSHAICRNEFE